MKWEDIHVDDILKRESTETFKKYFYYITSISPDRIDYYIITTFYFDDENNIEYEYVLRKDDPYDLWLKYEISKSNKKELIKGLFK